MLLSFLNALFQGRKQIIDLTYNNTEKHGPQKRYRGIRYDLTCTDQDGTVHPGNAARETGFFQGQGCLLRVLPDPRKGA